MPKNNISEIVANGMFEALNSESHAKLFKKAYVQKEAAVTPPPAAAKPAAPVVPAAKPAASAPMKADDNDARKSDKCPKCKMEKCECKGNCKKCGRDKDNCYCGDSMMADDANNTKECMDCGMAKDKCTCKHGGKDNALAKESKAFNVAMESLLTASAALDYAGLVKGSELTLKLAALVAEAKRGKVNLKGDKKSSKPAKSVKKEDKADARSKLTNQIFPMKLDPRGARAHFAAILRALGISPDQVDPVLFYQLYPDAEDDAEDKPKEEG